jgi:hypothetical protein
LHEYIITYKFEQKDYDELEFDIENGVKYKFEQKNDDEKKRCKNRLYKIE